MSVLLDELIRKRKEQALSYEEYLKKIIDLAKKTKDPSSSESYPSDINSKAKMALYDNLGRDRELALAIDRVIMETKPDDWRNTAIKRRVVENAIKRFIYDEEKAREIFELVKEQGEY